MYFFEQMVFMGNKSLFIVLLTSSFSGAVFAYQIYLGFTAFSVDSFVGPIVAIAICKELAPVFTGLVVAGRCGAAMAAQIGTMKVTEQVDALKSLSQDVIVYLVCPRVVSLTLMMPLLTFIQEQVVRKVKIGLKCYIECIPCGQNRKGLILM